MIKVTERIPNFVDPGDDYKYWESEFKTLFEVFGCELAERWRKKLGDNFSRMAINAYSDPTGIWINDGYMLTVYDKENTTYNIAWIK